MARICNAITQSLAWPWLCYRVWYHSTRASKLSDVSTVSDVNCRFWTWSNSITAYRVSWHNLLNYLITSAGWLINIWRGISNQFRFREIVRRCRLPVTVAVAAFVKRSPRPADLYVADEIVLSICHCVCGHELSHTRSAADRACCCFASFRFNAPTVCLPHDSYNKLRFNKISRALVIVLFWKMIFFLP